ncbi:isopentenyl-diphosphate Delta-isomerase [Nocardia iowensis]|uniref:isopentenyl-diphosphate Delta-isomerase n=1 Tax=Nocardia iowensis TaxID=204891 RepID=UPI001FE9E8EE|nr:isopentenyl-diphosphate Delta-isomerase [Nocardia iowensis]
MTAKSILLELVSPDGATIGTAEKLSAHQPPGRLHRAFSVFLFDATDRMLLQRRALTKYHSPGVWSNTCCGHPLPGEPPAAAAARRTHEELGLTPTAVVPAGTVTYNHPDTISGLVEWEYNHLYVGRADHLLQPDPNEVHETLFASPDDLTRMLAQQPFSSWFRTVLAAALPEIRRLAPNW